MFFVGIAVAGDRLFDLPGSVFGDRDVAGHYGSYGYPLRPAQLQHTLNVFAKEWCFDGAFGGLVFASDLGYFLVDHLQPLVIIGFCRQLQHIYFFNVDLVARGTDNAVAHYKRSRVDTDNNFRWLLQGEVIFTRMKVSKNIKIFINYFLGPLLFCWLAFSIYRHIVNQPHLDQTWQQIRSSFQSYRIVNLIAALLLVPVNWGFEAWKWKLSVDPSHRISFGQAFRATLSGVSFSVTMPNRIGEYLGRVLYLPEGRRLQAVPLTLVGSFAQLLVTLVMGTAGLVVLKKPLLLHFEGLVIWYQFALYGLLAVIVILTLLYFKVASVVQLYKRWIKIQRHLYLVEALGQFGVQLLIKILLLSFLRYCVFLLQYVLIFNLCGVEIDAALLAWLMSVVFLAMSVIPSIALLELGLRGEISLKLVGIYTANTLGITITTISIWFMNLVVPAVIGSLLMLSIKVFNKNDEET